MKTFICAEYQKEPILRKAAAAHGGTVFGISTKTLSNIMRTENESSYLLEMKLSYRLQSEKEQFPIYSRMFSYPAFIQEILSFAKECALYQIDPDDLPSSDPQKDELRRIIKTALTFPLYEKDAARRKEAAIRSYRKMKDVVLYPYFENNPFYYHMRKELASFLPCEALPEVSPAKKFMYAMNPRQEIEAAAQHICQTGQPCLVVLTSLSSQLPVVQEVFNRYGIPFSVTHQEYHPKVRNVFLALLKLAVNKDMPSFIEALKEDAFPVFFPDSTISFAGKTLKDFKPAPDVSETLRNSIFKDEADDYDQSAEELQSLMEQISEDLSSVLSAENAADSLRAAFGILRKSPFLKDRDELTAAMQIRSAVNEVLSLIRTEDDLRFFAASLENHGFSASVSLTDFCTVTDLTHPADPAVNTYVIGCSGQNYPGIPSRTGLFDERYLSETPGYPDAAERYSIYKEQLEWISHSASDTVFYSFATNDYQGREIEPSFELEEMFRNKHPQKWPLLELRPASEPEHAINPETAEKLFRRDGSLHGSISTIERWFQCPYSYFIQSGLKIRKKEEAGSDNASIGTIQHALAEESVNTHGKDYADLSEDEIRDFLKPSFDALRKMNPNDREIYELIETRMIQGLKSALEYLAVYEKHSSFIPAYAEMHFGYPEEDVEIIDGVRLRGTIDRLDFCREMMRVVDYKSSLHTLSETKMKAGLQLQLLTYLIIAGKFEKKTPVGAYYYSFKPDSMEIPAAKATSKAVADTDWSPEAERERIFSLRGLKGWTFESRFTELDDDQKFISPRTIYDYDLVKKCIFELYAYFRDSLLAGDISLSPTETACMFCDYKPICRFHGEARKAVPLVFKDISLKKGGR